MSAKVFIEQEEEIIFVIEKILSSEKNNVILIVPEKASLLGSLVNLKILASEICESDKLLVIVSTDEFGLKLCKKSGIMAVDEVDKIDNSVWKKAQDLKDLAIKAKIENKEKLIEAREVKEEDEKMTGKREINEIREVKKTVKLKPQKINIDGFEMIAGGDIREFESDLLATKDTEDNLPDLGIKNYNEKTELENEAKFPKNVGIQRDFSKVQSRFISDSSNKLKNTISGFQLKKSYFVYLFFLIFVLVSTIFVVSNVFSEARVVVKVKSEETTIQSKVSANLSINELNLLSNEIPAVMLEESADIARDGLATKIQKSGENANGKVTIFNLTDSEITIPAETQIEAIETGLKYKTRAEVTVPRKTSNDFGTYLGNVDVGIIALSFGSEYNIVGKNLSFKVKGYDVSKQIYAKNFTNITGGTTVEKKVVGETDIAELKKQLFEELKVTALQNLKKKNEGKNEIIDETVKYEEVKVESIPALDQEAETFTLTLEIKAKAMGFSKEQLDKIAETLIKNSKPDANIEKFEYKSQVIDSSNTKVVINLEIIGIASPKIDSATFKKEIAGKSIDSANSYLKSKNEILSFYINFSPSWLPRFLKKIPNDENKIVVIIEK